MSSAFASSGLMRPWYLLSVCSRTAAVHPGEGGVRNRKKPSAILQVGIEKGSYERVDYAATNDVHRSRAARRARGQDSQRGAAGSRAPLLDSNPDPGTPELRQAAV